MTFCRPLVSCALAAALAFNVALADRTDAQSVDASSAPESSGHARAIEITDLISLTDIGGAVGGLFPSPDRAAVGFQTRRMNVDTNGYQLDWWLLPLAGGSPIWIGAGGEPVTGYLDNGWNNGSLADPIAAWSPDGAGLAYLHSSGGEIQIWYASRDGRNNEQVTYHSGDIESFVWTPDNKQLLFTSRLPRSALHIAEQAARDDGFLWDDNVSIGYSRLPVSPRTGDDKVWIVDIGSKNIREATPQQSQEFAELTASLKLRARPKARVVVRSSAGRVASLDALDQERQGWRAPLSVVVSTGPDGYKATACPDPACTGQIPSLRWGAGGDKVYFTRLEGHGDSAMALYEWRPGARRARLVFRTDGWLGNDCEFVGDRAICLYESATQPRRIVAISLRDGALKSLFEPNPNFGSIRWTKIEKLQWLDRYGNETYGHLVYPADYHPNQQYPLVIVQYRSRGFLRGGVGDEYPIHVFAANGFLVLSWDRPEFRTMDARLQTEEAGNFEYAENREYLSKLSALDLILDQLVARGLVDSGRVGITGLSDGAETVDLALIHSQRFAAAITSQLVSDPIAYYLLSASDRQQLKLIGLVSPADPQRAADFWGYISPALNVNKLRTPLLAQLSESEATTAAQTIAAMQDAGKPFEAYIYPDSFHVKNRPRHLLRSMQRSVDWLNFWLRDVEDPAKEKIEQYRRWRELRARLKPELQSAD